MTYSDYEGLRFERRPNGVLLITINSNPAKLNPIDEKLHQDLGRVWLDVDRDPETRVVVVTGAGNAFSAGGDFEMERRILGSFANTARAMKESRDIVMNMVNCEKPIISAINGIAVGAGLAVGLLADISMVGDEVRFTDGHTRMGFTAGDHAAIIWPLLCGLAKAKYYLLTADFISGPEAERIGLVSKCVPQERLLIEAFSVADRLAIGPEFAIRWTKRSLNHWLRNAQPIFEASLALEMLNNFDPDVKEGLDALEGKKQPEFGRANGSARPRVDPAVEPEPSA
jgi:enoyl-CoA hydratase